MNEKAQSRRKVKKAIRRRGYNDKGSLRPSWKWIEKFPNIVQTSEKPKFLTINYRPTALSDWIDEDLSSWWIKELDDTGSEIVYARNQRNRRLKKQRRRRTLRKERRIIEKIISTFEIPISDHYSVKEILLSVLAEYFPLGDLVPQLNLYVASQIEAYLFQNLGQRSFSHKLELIFQCFLSFLPGIIRRRQSLSEIDRLR